MGVCESKAIQSPKRPALRMSCVMSNVKIIEANFRARDAHLSAGPTVLRLFLVQFSAALGRHISKITFGRFANEPLSSSLLLSNGDGGHRYEFRTEDANSLHPKRVAIWFGGLPGSRKACLPPSCLAGPLSRFQGSKGWACLGSSARAVYPPLGFFVFEVCIRNGGRARSAGLQCLETH